MKGITEKQNSTQPQHTSTSSAALHYYTAATALRPCLFFPFFLSNIKAKQNVVPPPLFWHAGQVYVMDPFFSRFQ